MRIDVVTGQGSTGVETGWESNGDRGSMKGKVDWTGTVEVRKYGRRDIDLP